MINGLDLKHKLQYPYFNLLKLLYLNTCNHYLCMLMYLSCLNTVRASFSKYNKYKSATNSSNHISQKTKCWLLKSCLKQMLIFNLII